jgi:hypothetical protein
MRLREAPRTTRLAPRKLLWRNGGGDGATPRWNLQGSAVTEAVHAHTMAALPSGYGRIMPPSGIAPCPSCQEGKNSDGNDCIACRSAGALDLCEVPKSDAQSSGSLVC